LVLTDINSGAMYHLYGLTNRVVLGTGAVYQPTTDIVATASTTLDLGEPTADHVLGGLTLSGAGTTVSVANAAGVTFGGIDGAASTGLDLGAAEALTLNVADGASASFAGVISNGAGTVSLAKTGQGTQVLAGVNTYTGATTVSGGTLSVTGSLGSSDVTVAHGAALAGGGSVASAALEAGGGFTWCYGDGGDHTLDVSGALSLADNWVIKLVDLGGDPVTGGKYNLLTYGGAYTGDAAFSDALANIAIDATEAADWNIDNLSVVASGGRVYITGIGVPGVAGDADENGVVNAADYIILKTHMGQPTGAGASDGDFNDDGRVNYADLVILQDNYGKTSADAPTIPEPATFFVMMAAGLPALLKRRQRRN